MGIFDIFKSSKKENINPIFNSIGKCIHNQKISESKSIDLSSYPSGIYLVSIKSKDKIYSGKVVKQ